MNRTLPKLAAVCLLLLVLVSPRPHRQSLPAPVSPPSSIMSREDDPQAMARVARWQQGVKAAAIAEAVVVPAGKPQQRIEETTQREGTEAVQAPQEAASYDDGSIEQAICAAFGDACGRAVKVARCESTLRPDAMNGEHWGLFQIAVRVHAQRIKDMGYTAEDMLTVGPNIAVAYAIFTASGWGPWECRG